MDGLRLAAVRGWAGEESCLEAVLERSRPVTAQGLVWELGVSRKRAEAMMAALEKDGSLPPDSRARFASVLMSRKEESVTTALLQYYMKEALDAGRLQKEKHGVYRCL